MVLLALVAMVDMVDRGILPGVLVHVQREFGFSDTAAGLLGTAFVITGFLVVVPAGYMADRYRRTRIIAVVLASWGVISALNAAVRNYWQFLAVRAALGIGETIDNPASRSLIADYYRPEVRGRAYALQGIAPIVGGAIGTGLGGAVAALAGWRWAFLLVGVPGSLLAYTIWRMPEPRRGESDGVAPSEDEGTREAPAPPEEGAVTATAAPEAALADEARGRGLASLMRDVRVVVQVKTLRSLMVGSAFAIGVTTGMQFWAPAFYERHTALGAGGGAGVTAGLILVGALTGTWFGGVLADRLRPRYEGAPMLLAGVSICLAGALLMSTFLPVPLWYRIPVQVVGVAGIVAGLPAITTMISEVVPGTIRGISFAVVGFVGAVVGAASPLALGALADLFPFTVDGEVKGHIANAFLVVMPLVIIGGLVLLRGRRHVAADTARAMGTWDDALRRP